MLRALALTIGCLLLVASTVTAPTEGSENELAGLLPDRIGGDVYTFPLLDKRDDIRMFRLRDEDLAPTLLTPWLEGTSTDFGALVHLAGGDPSQLSFAGAANAPIDCYLDPDVAESVCDATLDDWEEGDAVLVIAVRAPGLDADALLDSLLEWERWAPSFQKATLGDRRVLYLKRPTDEWDWDWAFWYPRGDVLWLAEGNGAPSMLQTLVALPD